MLTGTAQVDAYLSVFLTDTDRTPRKSVVTKKFCDNNPAVGKLFESEDFWEPGKITAVRHEDFGTHPGGTQPRLEPSCSPV